MGYEEIVEAIWIIALLVVGFLFLKFWPGMAGIYRSAAIWALAGMDAEKARAETRARLTREFGAGEQAEVRS